MRVRTVLFLLLAAFSVPLMAQSPQQVLSQAEASLVVTGQVDIEADGSVSAHRINRRDSLPDYVVAMVDDAAAKWRFEPEVVDGQAVPARARMNLRLVARPVEGDQYEVVIANGSFGEYSDEASDHVTRRGTLAAPRYPADMVRRSAEGVVQLLVKVGRDGSVEDVIAEQVNLYSYGNGREMERMRNVFARRSVDTARGWEFDPPTTGALVDRDFWVIRVPIEYTLSDASASADAWQRYIPGPRHPGPDWKDFSGASDSDAMVAGQIQMVGNERRLLTPLGDG